MVPDAISVVRGREICCDGSRSPDLSMGTSAPRRRSLPPLVLTPRPGARSSGRNKCRAWLMSQRPIWSRHQLSAVMLELLTRFRCFDSFQIM